LKLPNFKFQLPIKLRYGENPHQSSIIAVNRKINAQLAQLMLKNKRFFEILLCPYISASAQKVFAIKKI